MVDILYFCFCHEDTRTHSYKGLREVTQLPVCAQMTLSNGQIIHENMHEFLYLFINSKIFDILGCFMKSFYTSHS